MHQRLIARFGLRALLALMIVVACDDGTGPDLPGPPAALIIVSGTDQEGVVGQELDAALVVRVEDADGDPISGQLVNFVVTAGDGEVFAGSALTNSNGVAQERWTLGTSTADSQRVEVRAVDPETGAPLVFAIFRARALADIPDSLEIVGGNAFATEAGETIVQPLSVRVLDQFGNPVPEATVAWTSDAAGASFDPAQSATDSSGIASTSWTVGTEAGPQTAEATIAALSAEFAADVTAGAVAVVELSADSVRFGALQSQRQLTAEARDEFGNVVETAFTWSMSAGGVAAVGSAGLLTSQGNGAAYVMVEAGSARDSAAVVVQQVLHALTVQPGSDTVFVDQTVQLLAVDSDSNGIAIAGSPAGTWSTTQPSIAQVDANGIVTGEAVGVAQITFDAGAVAASATLRVMREDTINPVVTITTPQPNAVATPEIRVAATCVDDDPLGCTSIEVSVVSLGVAQVLFTRPGAAIDTVIDLSAYNGRTPVLVVRGRDPLNNGTASRALYVEASPSLTPVDSISGVVLDALDTRALYFDAGELRVFDRVSRSSALVATLADTPDVARLTTGGAIFVRPSPAVSDTVIEYRGGMLNTHTPLNGSTSLDVAGAYAIWSNGLNLYALESVSGVRSTVSNTAGNISNDVASNGDVVFWSSGTYEIERWRAGSTTALTSDSVYWNTYPVTDGTSVVFRRHDPCCSGQRYRLVLHTGTAEVLLTEFSTRSLEQDTDYSIGGGLVAFTHPDGAGNLQVWVRRPSGVIEQITHFTGFSPRPRIESVGPNGDVILYEDRRYLWSAATGGAPVDIGPGWGVVRWIADEPHLLLGNTIFRIE